MPTEPPPAADEVRIAFVADTFYSVLNRQQLAYPFDYLDPSLSKPGRVLKLIYAEGAELTLHGGDIGYDEGGSSTPEKWDLSVDQILGPDYPIFASGGNHDRRHWDSAPRQFPFDGLGYKDVLGARYNAVTADPNVLPGLSCTFDDGPQDIGRKATCVYKNITFITTAIGNWESPTSEFQNNNSYEQYLKDSLDAATTPWVICNWHFNQTKFQSGFKSNEAGWKPYEYCRQAGAIIATGHEHSYSRTHLMSRFAEDSTPADIVMTGPNLKLDEGETLAWVSGLGGASLRSVSDQINNPWWAVNVNSTNLSNSNGSGVLFCDFGTLPGDSQASCFYKTIDGAVRDRFELVSNANGATGEFEVPFVNTNSAPSVSPINDQTIVVGEQVTLNISANDNDGPEALEYWAKGLPSGFSINRSSGRISGQSFGPGTVDSVISVWDGADSTDIDVQWTMLQPTPTPTPTPRPTATPAPTPTPTVVKPEVAPEVVCDVLAASLVVTVTNNGPGFATYRVFIGTTGQARSMSPGLSSTITQSVANNTPVQLTVTRNDFAVYEEVIDVTCTGVQATPTPAPTSTAVPTPDTGNPIGADAPVQVMHASTCLAGNGRVDTNIVNTGLGSAVYRIEFEGLTARASTVAAGDWWRMPVTGRPDDTFTVNVKRDGVVVSTQEVVVSCDSNPASVSTPEIQVVNSCRAGNGYILFQFVNPTDAMKSYIIRFENVLNRSTSAAPYGGTVRSVTGRPDGTHNVEISSGSTVVASMTITVDCD